MGQDYGREELSSQADSLEEMVEKFKLSKGNTRFK
jgi:hypothetical protein